MTLSRKWLRRLVVLLGALTILFLVLSITLDTSPTPVQLKSRGNNPPIASAAFAVSSQLDTVQVNRSSRHRARQLERVTYHPIYRQVIVNAMPRAATDASSDKLPKSAVLSAKETYEFFKNILLIVIFSPKRFELAYDVWQHYRIFFRYMTFCSSVSTTVDGIRIDGYNVVFGNMQYLAASRIVENITRTAKLRRGGDDGNKTSFPFEGFLFNADDLLLSPWAIAASRLNKSSTWASMMGIANVKSNAWVLPVSGMSVEKQFRYLRWPYFRKSRERMYNVIRKGGEPYENALRAAAEATSRKIYSESHYPVKLRNLSLHANGVMFYTIVDAYYVPRKLVTGFVDVTDNMAKYFIQMECAIPTALRILQPTYEMLKVQYYWSSSKQEDCVRSRWTMSVHGFHRCRHDHRFANLIYSNDTLRRRLYEDRELLRYAKNLKGLE
ncbi:putative membrane-associated protein [Trypanosoma theileri]|uniref:Putative membrane-associated protein n=1 Tax=Trypanosoma theileri TaxID=67003 RepID=A0A1X0P1B2_9TRYP|nr:putative membrane-associated protein [Trypanosoma theileri]ORC90493.1 putative membrane-associated protein [Trypanosoma theileri]